MLKNKKEIENWLEQYLIEDYTINKDLTVNVNNSIYLFDCNLDNIPIKFDKVNGDFSCCNNSLTTLNFCPQIIEGDFNCCNNNLTSLMGCSREIYGTFDCSLNKLKSLEFCPDIVNKRFDCSFNKLTNLEFCPKKINGSFNCSNNLLSSLEFCSQIINGDFNCNRNKIEKENLYLFYSNILGNILSDFGNKENFLILVQEQKILKEKEKLINNLENTEYLKLTKKRL